MDKTMENEIRATEKTATPNWNGFAASIPGGGHIRHGIPCQDASAVMTAPRPAAIVCDGRGSASLSHFGAQGAVEAFRFQMSIMEPFLVNILDSEEVKDDQWIKFCRIMYRTLMQVKYDLAEERHTEEKEFDCTVAFAIAGTHHIGCFQVGDGSIVLRQNGVCKTVFPPEKGEFANQTHFLRAGGEETIKFQHALFDTMENSGIAITSDGPEHLMFRLSDMTPGKIFDMFLEDLRKEELCKQDIMDYLTRSEWAKDPRGADDRSLAVLARVGCEVPEEVMPEEQAQAEAKSELEPDAEEKPEPVEKQETETEVEDIPEKQEEKTQVEAELTTESPMPSSLPKKTSALPGIAVASMLLLALIGETAYLIHQERIIAQQKTAIQQLYGQLSEQQKPMTVAVKPAVTPDSVAVPEPAVPPEEDTIEKRPVDKDKEPTVKEEKHHESQNQK